ncbi:hypothetical protein [Rhizobium lusitanum]|uniref:Uncharacterized protein n=1 Tax=Rhizobium lusitanum TaxID=293958 RepID=A0A7X0IVW5_9HYPH|nr:hypothetical protein [Rhizobium lusitanum]MBB6487814.1 hypothetical protein [Rhizobium lusitanum]
MAEGDLVDEAMGLGRYAELLAMLEGTSKYSDVELFERLDRHSRRLRSMAIMHLQFIVEFGYVGQDKKNITVGNRIHSNFPDYFEAWKLAGIPGMASILLENMISDFKSSSNKK